MIELIKTKRIEDITVAEITELADVGKSTFYRLYHDIYDVFEELTEAFAERAVGVMVRLVFFDNTVDFSEHKSIIDFKTAMTIFGLEEADMILVNYLFEVKSMKTFHLVVERFRAIAGNYAKESGLDEKQADYYTKFVMNGLLYSTLTDYQYSGTLNMRFIELLKSFSVDETDLRSVKNGKAE